MDTQQTPVVYHRLDTERRLPAETVLHSQGVLLDRLWREVRELGSQAAVADKYAISRAYLNDLLHHRRDISPEMAERMGYYPVALFFDRAPQPEKWPGGDHVQIVSQPGG